MFVLILLAFMSLTQTHISHLSNILIASYNIDKGITLVYSVSCPIHLLRKAIEVIEDCKINRQKPVERRCLEHQI